MGQTSIYIIIVILLLLILFAIIYFKRKEKKPTDYRTLFILGITWIPLGIATENYVFTAVGAVFIAIGLAKKDKWKEEKKWSGLSPQERKLKLLVLVIGSAILLAGILFYFLLRK